MKQIDKQDYSISCPADWEMQTNKPPTEFIVLSPLNGAEDDFADNFNLLKQDLTGRNINLLQYDSVSEADITNTLGANSILQSKEENGHHSIIYKGALKGRNLKWKQLYFMKNEIAYVLTYTAEEKNYDKYSDIAEAFFNSFKLK